jgi:hypothetical protein
MNAATASTGAEGYGPGDPEILDHLDHTTYAQLVIGEELAVENRHPASLTSARAELLAEEGI